MHIDISGFPGDKKDINQFVALAQSMHGSPISLVDTREELAVNNHLQFVSRKTVTRR